MRPNRARAPRQNFPPKSLVVPALSPSQKLADADKARYEKEMEAYKKKQSA